MTPVPLLTCAVPHLLAASAPRVTLLLDAGVQVLLLDGNGPSRAASSPAGRGSLPVRPLAPWPRPPRSPLPLPEGVAVVADAELALLLGVGAAAREFSHRVGPAVARAG